MLGTVRRCMPLVIVLSLIVPANISIGTRVAHATSFNTITVDGNCGDWASDEKFTGNDGTQTWITWDSTNIYVGWVGGGGNNQKRIIAFDLDPGASDGSSINYSGVTFPAQGQPDYVAEVSNNNTFFTTRTGGSLSTATNPSGAHNFFSSSGSNCPAGNNFVELSLARTLFSGGSISGLTSSNGMGVDSYFDDPSGGANAQGFIYGGMPQGKIGSGNANQPQAASDEEFFPSTDGSRSPTMYGRLLFTVSGNIHWDGLFSDQSSFYMSPVEPVQGGPLTIRFRSTHGDLTGLNLNWYDSANSGAGFNNWIPMHVAGQDATGQYDIWQVDASALLSSSSTKFYRFEAIQGNATTWYNANGATCGSGTQQSCQAPASSNFWVIPGFHTPDWAKNATFYQIFPDRFKNGDASNDLLPYSSGPVTPGSGGSCPATTYNYGGTCAYTHSSWSQYPDGSALSPGTSSVGADFFGGDLAGITQEIDPYLKGTLGVNALYLNPIFQSPSNHKYDTQDYFTVDPHFGTNTGSSQGSLTTLIGTAHGTGDFTGDFRMSVMLDGVFNHTGDWNCWFDRPQFSACGGNGAWENANSPYRGWYEFLPGFDPNTAPNNYCAWSGFGSLPQLNYSAAGVRDIIYRAAGSVMRTYLSAPYDVDGWRLDVADNYSDLDTASSACQIGNDNHSIWQEIRSYLKGSQAVSHGLPQLTDSLILGEYWQKPTDWLGGDQWDSVMNYNGFNQPISQFITGEGVHGNDPGAGNYLTPSALNAWFTGTLADNNRSSQLVMLNSLTTHDIARFLYRACTSLDSNTSDCLLSSSTPQSAFDRLKLATEMQMTYVGMPSIYYGDEIGMTGNNDPDNRRPFDWNEADWNVGVLNLTKTLVHNRAVHESMRDGSFMPLVIDDANDVYGYGRVLMDPSTLSAGAAPSDAAITLVNNSGTSHTESVPAGQLSLIDGTSLTDLVSGQTYTVSGGSISITLPAYTGAVLVTAKPAAALEASGVPASATLGTPVTFQLSAADASSNAAIDYTGTVHFSSSDPNATLPSDYTFSPNDLGAKSFSVTFWTPGPQTVTVTDGSPTPLTVSTGQVDVTIPISSGWNLIDVPLSGNISTASQLLSSLNASLGSGVATEAAVYGAGGWQTYEEGFSPTDVPIDPGDGVFVYSSGSGQWLPPGSPYTSGNGVTLRADWNLIAAPFPYHGLSTDAIQGQMTGCDVQEIATYGSGGYDVYVPGFTDPFVVPAYSGAWVLCASSGSWSPHS